MTEKHIQKMKGVVVSTKMAKTVVVEVARLKKHPIYKKFMRITKRYKAHNENPNVAVGDRVVMVSTRPISKEKRWRVVEENV